MKGLSMGRRAAWATLLFASSSAFAQTDTAPRSDGYDDPEIVVTAQRRAENIQKVPLAVDAIGGDLLSKGVKSVADLEGLATSTQIQQNANALNVSIRGITTNSVNLIADTAIAYGYNGTPILHAAALPSGLYDLERVEVLRGPQGTLYGRSATGGAVNFITNKPVFDFEASALASYGNYDFLDLAAMVNAPLGSNTAIRLVGQRTRHDGYLDNGFNDQNEWSGRVGLLTEPTDTLSIFVGADYSRRKGKGWRLTSCPPGSSAAPAPIPGVVPNYCADFPWDPYGGGPFDEHSDLNFTSDKTGGIYGEVRLDLQFGTLVYVPSYREIRQKAFVLATSTVRLPVAGGDYAHVGNEVVDGRNQLHSQELRLESSGAGPLKWVLGGIYIDDQLKDFRDSHTNLPFAGPLPPTGIRVFTEERKFLGTESLAAFGQVTYPLADAVRLTGGIRYTHDKKTSRGTTFVTQATGTVLPIPGDGDLSSDRVTWRLAIDADLAENSLFYASVSTGYKAGGFNSGIQPNLYDPETITAYEAGIKNEFLDRRLRLNLTGFYYDYSNYQFQFFGTVFVPNPADPGGPPIPQQQSVTAPAEKARVKGVELESAFKATPSTNLDLSVSYLDATFTRFAFGPTDYSGNPLPYAPKWTISGGIRQSISLGDAGQLDLSVRSLYNSRQTAYYFNAPGAALDDYTRTDASLTFTPSSDRFSVSAWVRNLEDHARITQFLTQSPFNPTQALVAAPRTFGVTLEAKY